MKSRFAVLGGLCCTLTFAANVAAETIVHEDFEGPFAPIERMESPDGTFLREGALPAGWEDHSESTPQHVKYGLSADPYEGKQALRIEVSNIQAGNSAAQLVRRGIALKKGCVYVMSMALRSVELQSVDIGFRPASGPNQWNLSCEAVASPDWAVSEFVVVAPASDPNAILQLRVRRAGAAEIDNVRVEELTREEFLQRYPAKPGNILETSRFSLGAANGWTLPRNGGTFVTDPNEKGPSGAPALKIL
ncbi:MAG: hypothetical protein NTW86_30165, partial [Candidatus Sumerlaeota bacterium]|nr:hypothetical protein [Candidatus Sumerlaeota bacterium]